MRPGRTCFPAAVGLLALLGFATLFAVSERPPAKKPQSRPAQTAPKTSTQTQKSSAPNLQVQSADGITVRENYFLELPGFDLSTLTPKQKERFLERVNKEICTCGCPNDTIARCLVNDPKCPTVRGLAQKVFSDVKAGR